MAQPTTLMPGLFDGNLINNVASAGLISWRVVWGFVLLTVTAAVGLLAAEADQTEQGPRLVPSRLSLPGQEHGIATALGLR